MEEGRSWEMIPLVSRFRRAESLDRFFYNLLSRKDFWETTPIQGDQCAELGHGP